MSRAHHILIVEDEPVTRATLSGYFAAEGYRISEAGDGEALRRAFARGDVDLVLLDINLPGEDGLSLLRDLRRTSEVGVIMVTGKSDAVDRIVALELGADDYVTKPFDTRELLARSKNLLRRTQAARAVTPDAPVKRFDGWALDLDRRSLTDPQGSDVRLTRGEFDLLAALASNAGRVLTRDSLLDHVSHRDWAPNDRTVDVLVGRLRRKIERDAKVPTLIVTVHGVGYLFTGR
ncbi:MAG: two-component system response regulator TorR [Rhodobacterales bacterium]|nr:two-component system response regulator TorR [Rhodobacterales bacterium]